MSTRGCFFGEQLVLLAAKPSRSWRFFGQQQLFKVERSFLMLNLRPTKGRIYTGHVQLIHGRPDAIVFGPFLRMFL